ncbi:MAG: hypothetical protein GEU92_04350 [Alphaproteobacteria bacterium]|nr:hypothetical protein [Alphaproteobacteria bacterium]
MKRPHRTGEVLQRLAAAGLGGYALAIAVSVCLSSALPLARPDAVVSGLLASFAVYLAAILWVFAERSLTRMWLGIGAATAGCLALWVLLPANPAP